jgi:hypothetical protein
VPFPEDAVRDITQERKSGDEDDDQPQLLGVPCAERSVGAIGEKGQHRAGDHRIACEGLHIVFVKLVEETVQLRLQGEQQRHDCGASDCEARLAKARDETQPDRGDRSHRCRRVGPALEARSVGISDRENCDASSDESAGGECLSKAARKPCQARRQADQGKGPNACYARARAKPAKIKPALDSDEEAAGERGRDRQRLPVPVAVHAAFALDR